MLANLKIRLRRMRLRVSCWIRDPDLDILGLGVFATLAGRVLLFGSLAFGLLASGLWLPAIVTTMVLGVDVFTQVEVLGALRRLMRYEVAEEIARSFNIGGLEVVAD